MLSENLFKFRCISWNFIPHWFWLLMCVVLLAAFCRVSYHWLEIRHLTLKLRLFLIKSSSRYIIKKEKNFKISAALVSCVLDVIGASLLAEISCRKFQFCCQHNLSTQCVCFLLTHFSTVPGQTLRVHWQEICDSLFLPTGLYLCLSHRFV